MVLFVCVCVLGVLGVFVVVFVVFVMLEVGVCVCVGVMWVMMMYGVWEGDGMCVCEVWMMVVVVFCVWVWFLLFVVDVLLLLMMMLMMKVMTMATKVTKATKAMTEKEKVLFEMVWKNVFDLKLIVVLLLLLMVGEMGMLLWNVFLVLSSIEACAYGYRFAFDLKFGCACGYVYVGECCEIDFIVVCDRGEIMMCVYVFSFWGDVFEY